MIRAQLDNDINNKIRTKETTTRLVAPLHEYKNRQLSNRRSNSIEEIGTMVI